jgi:hypothetical protein
MRVTKQQLFKHYLEAGMPEVYAAMAANEDIGTDYVCAAGSSTLINSFSWNDSALGGAFWHAIYEELRHENY